MSNRGERPLRMQTPRSTSPALERSTAYRGTPKAGGAFAVWQLSRYMRASGSLLPNRTPLQSTKSLHRQAFCFSAMRHIQSAHISGHLRLSIPAPATEGGCCREREGTVAHATATVAASEQEPMFHPGLSSWLSFQKHAGPALPM